MTDNKTDTYFTLQQRAALAIAANMADDQFETAERTQHYFTNLTRYLNYDKPLSCKLKCLIKNLRNYFSHFKHKDIDPLDQVLRNFYKELYQTVREQLLGHNAPSAIENRYKTDRKKAAIEYLSNNNLDLFSFEGKVNHLPQYTIAFMLAPFINRSEANRLCQRIYFFENAFNEEGEKRVNTPKVAAIKELISKTAQPDSVTIRAHSGDNEQWLPPKAEWAISVLNHLKDNYPLDGKEELEDRYYFNQLIKFIMFNQVLPCAFERIETVIQDKEDLDAKNKRLEQKRIFSDDDNLPLNIKYNTIAIKWSDVDVTGTLSLKALEIIVVAYLKLKKNDHKLKKDDHNPIATFIHDWLSENKNYLHRKPASEKQSKLDHIIKKRCKYLTDKYSEHKSDRLYDQITFICQRVAVAWQAVHDKPLSKHEYEKLRDIVQHFDKERLRSFLGGQVWQKSAIELGRGNEKQLRKAITKDNIGDVYNDMTKAYCDYLAGVSEGLHKRTHEEKCDLAKRLKCRWRSKIQPALPKFPVGIPPRLLRYKLIDEGKKKYVGLDTLGQSIKGYVGLPLNYHKPEKNENMSTQSYSKALQIWFQKQLTLGMAWFEFGKMLKNDNGRINDVKSLEDWPNLEITLKDAPIIIKVAKLKRNHTRLDKSSVSDLIKHYIDDGKEPIPMFRANEERKGRSIESAYDNCNSDRLILIEAALRYEKKWRQDKNNREKIEEETEENGFIQFKKILPEPDNDVGKYRNAAFHNKVMKFTDCPAPLAEWISYIQNKQKEKAKKYNQKPKKE